MILEISIIQTLADEIKTATKGDFGIQDSKSTWCSSKALLVLNDNCWPVIELRCKQLPLQMSNMLCAVLRHFQSCPTLCNPMGCSPPDFSVHGILQSRILEWGAVSFSRESSPPRDRTHLSYLSCIDRWVLYPEVQQIIVEAKIPFVS